MLKKKNNEIEKRVRKSSHTIHETRDAARPPLSIVLPHRWGVSDGRISDCMAVLDYQQANLNFPLNS